MSSRPLSLRLARVFERLDRRKRAARKAAAANAIRNPEPHDAETSEAKEGGKKPAQAGEK
ncbi:MAG: hypothetical protein J0J10_19210 [Bosea sp.]|jgi:hypothetical protein|uniref:hypothetical protein n=1 Tax=Bosea sp. (in: a-proteobacteria) TaxID=1871050 RepID=UPI001AD5899C|nr:hypothetical protein [Bosea sp. (in: a-proteobacteria)]MBN9470902.1 hypothetical protein [Bosea sp. (in: a-proteobacteria)]